MNREIEISNNNDLIDSRDIDDRIDYLMDAIYETEEDIESKKKACVDCDLQEHDLDEYTTELELLESIRRNFSGDSEWGYGITFIRETYFEDYARELAEDIGAISRDESWPLNHIDWESAADELKIDYSELDIDGIKYYYRSLLMTKLDLGVSPLTGKIYMGQIAADGVSFTDGTRRDVTQAAIVSVTKHLLHDTDQFADVGQEVKGIKQAFSPDGGNTWYELTARKLDGPPEGFQQPDSEE